MKNRTNVTSGDTTKNMTTNHSFDTDAMREEIIDRIQSYYPKDFLTKKETNIIRTSSLYKGRLSYVKDILINECSNIDENIVAERLDISKEQALLLLIDCLKKESQEEE